MKKGTLVIFALIFALFGGCRKIHDMKMHGYFYDKNTGIRLPNAGFNFTIIYYAPSSGSAIRGDHYSGTTDANGYYEIMIRDGEKKRQKYKRYDGDFFIDSVGICSFSLRPEFSDKHDMELDIGLKWQTAFCLILNNANPYDNNDVIENLYFENINNLSINNTPHIGASVHDSISFLFKTGPKILHSTITKNNITTQRTDTLTVLSTARTYYQLNY